MNDAADFDLDAFRQRALSNPLVQNVWQNKVVRFVRDLKIEPIVPVHSPLPYITRAAVFLRLDGWVPKVLAQEV
jgi:hypothetical protein